MPPLIHASAWWLLGLYVGAAGHVRVNGSWRLPAAVIGVAMLWGGLSWASRRNMRGTGLAVAFEPTRAYDHRVRGSRHSRLTDARYLAPLLALPGVVVAGNSVRTNDVCRRLITDILRGPALLSYNGAAAVGARSIGTTGAGAAVVWVRLAATPLAGQSVRVDIRERRDAPRCHVAGWLRLASPSAQLPGNAGSGRLQGNNDGTRAGALVAVTGRPSATVRSLRIDQGEVSDVAGRSYLLAWRAAIGATVDSLYGSRAPLVRALLIAEQQDIPADLRERFADAGLVHMLSVSGMHVAIIASGLLALGSVVRVPRNWLEPAALLLVTLYVAVLGFPAPAVRSGVMLAVVALSRRWQRPVHEFTALALGAVIPTFDPLAVLDLGWQLSVSGMAALVAARTLGARWQRWARSATWQRVAHAGSYPPYRAALGLCARLGRTHGISAWLVRESLTGVVATLVTAPVVAWTFGRVSIVAPLSNIPGGVVLALLQPALFLALLLAPLPGAASFVADASQPLMALLDGLASLAAGLPGAVMPVAPTITTALGGGLAAACVIRGSASRRPISWLLGAMASVVLAFWISFLRAGPGVLEMHVLDVGQGDAVALRTPAGHWVLVDAGPRWEGGDAARRVIIPYLRRRGGDVALFVLSHAHDDHAGGAATIVRALQPARWWESAFASTSPGYGDALAAVAQAGTRWQGVQPGESLELDGVSFTVLAPDSGWTAAQTDANETSVVLRVDYGRRRFLLTGDAESAEEAWVTAFWGAEELRADVLKVGHHGSRTSSSQVFLDAVRPRLAVVSLGAENRYGHPAPETLEALLERGVPLLRTDLEGTVVIRSDGRNLEVETKGERWQVVDR